MNATGASSVKRRITLRKSLRGSISLFLPGTPIFPQNALGAETTASVFGRELHSYVITDAIRDEKVLKFKVDYNDVRPQFQSHRNRTGREKLSAAENRQALLHPSVSAKSPSTS